MSDYDCGMTPEICINTVNESSFSLNHILEIDFWTRLSHCQFNGIIHGTLQGICRGPKIAVCQNISIYYIKYPTNVIRYVNSGFNFQFLSIPLFQMFKILVTCIYLIPYRKMIKIICICKLKSFRNNIFPFI